MRHYEKSGGCVSCHNGNPFSERMNIAHYRLISGKFAHFRIERDKTVIEGERLTNIHACRRCHHIGGSGNFLASSLDSAAIAKTPEEIYEAIKRPASGMPDFRFGESQIIALVNSIEAVAARSGDKRASPPFSLIFKTLDKKKRDIFTSRCGGCHKAISRKKGALGNGITAPNLSGIFTRHYPASFSNSGKWSGKRLKEWLGNPRKIRPMAKMQPVFLDDEEFRELMEVLEN